MVITFSEHKRIKSKLVNKNEQRENLVRKIKFIILSSNKLIKFTTMNQKRMN